MAVLELRKTGAVGLRDASVGEEIRGASFTTFFQSLSGVITGTGNLITIGIIKQFVSRNFQKVWGITEPAKITEGIGVPDPSSTSGSVRGIPPATPGKTAGIDNPL